MKLSGRKALITGASQGLGAVIARAFVENGAHVMLCARGEELLATVRTNLTELAAGRSIVLSQKADVSSPADVDAVAARAIKELGGLDILVCNAGV